jgi:hypothetical protein
MKLARFPNGGRDSKGEVKASLLRSLRRCAKPIETSSCAGFWRSSDNFPYKVIVFGAFNAKASEFSVEETDAFEDRQVMASCNASTNQLGKCNRFI